MPEAKTYQHWVNHEVLPRFLNIPFDFYQQGEDFIITREQIGCALDLYRTEKGNPKDPRPL